jgi:hypothetical protein
MNLQVSYDLAKAKPKELVKKIRPMEPPMLNDSLYPWANRGSGKRQGRALCGAMTSCASRMELAKHQPSSCSQNVMGLAARLGRGSMLKVATVFSILLTASVARAAVPTRVLIVDAVDFPPVLEKSNARQRMNDAVTSTVTEHGWEPVPSADCHDFTCAGPAAAAAKAPYALILSGYYARGGEAMYATDVGASLWHDGNVIARRTEVDEQAEAEKSATAVFFPCGPPRGTCAAPIIATKMQQYAARLLDAETAATQQRAAAAATVSVKVVAPTTVLVAAPTAPPRTDNGVGGILGWSLIGAGVAAVGGGIALWAYDNSGSACHSVAASGCRETRQTGTAAALVGGLGLAAGLAGVLVLVLDRGPSRVALSVSPGGLVLGGLF